MPTTCTHCTFLILCRSHGVPYTHLPSLSRSIGLTTDMLLHHLPPCILCLPGGRPRGREGEERREDLGIGCPAHGCYFPAYHLLPYCCSQRLVQDLIVLGRGRDTLFFGKFSLLCSLLLFLPPCPACLLPPPFTTVLFYGGGQFIFGRDRQVWH